MTPPLIRLCALLAGLGFVVEGAAVIGHPIPDQNWGTRGAVVDAAFAIAALATGAVLPSIARWSEARRPGLIAVRVARPASSPWRWSHSPASPRAATPSGRSS